MRSSVMAAAGHHPRCLLRPRPAGRRSGGLCPGHDFPPAPSRPASPCPDGLPHAHGCGPAFCDMSPVSTRGGVGHLHSQAPSRGWVPGGCPCSLAIFTSLAGKGLGASLSAVGVRKRPAPTGEAAQAGGRRAQACSSSLCVPVRGTRTSGTRASAGVVGRADSGPTRMVQEVPGVWAGETRGLGVHIGLTAQTPTLRPPRSPSHLCRPTRGTISFPAARAPEQGGLCRFCSPAPGSQSKQSAQSVYAKRGVYCSPRSKSRLHARFAGLPSGPQSVRLTTQYELHSSVLIIILLWSI